MGLNIKDEAVVALARKLAKETDDTMTGVIRKALVRLQNEHSRQEEAYWDAVVAERKRNMDEFLATLPKPAPGTTSDHSEFYDENGDPA